MRASTIVMIATAVVFGVLAVFVAQSWLNRQADLRMKNIESQRKTVSTSVVVVARSPLRFGMQISPQALREVEWPGDAIPAGAFTSIRELIEGDKRSVLSSIEPNEPIVAAKITGPGQKATLSAVLQEGMKAVTIRVNDVEGVAGFVLPGDRVDVLVTRQQEKEQGSSDIVLQSIRVLAIDQLADDRSDKPQVVKAVTLEVDSVSAQKLSLAASVGNLSLVLRKAGDVAEEGGRRVTLTDIGNSGKPAAGGFVNIGVIRSTKAAVKREDYSVPVDGSATQ